VTILVAGLSRCSSVCLSFLEPAGEGLARAVTGSHLGVGPYGISGPWRPLPCRVTRFAVEQSGHKHDRLAFRCRLPIAVPVGVFLRLFLSLAGADGTSDCHPSGRVARWGSPSSCCCRSSRGISVLAVVVASIACLVRPHYLATLVLRRAVRLSSI